VHSIPFSSLLSSQPLPRRNMLASTLSKPPKIQPYAPPSSLWTDLKVLYYMLFANVQGDTQQQRLESFYLLQADLYDSYRHRMLHARLPMIQGECEPVRARLGSDMCDMRVTCDILCMSDPMGSNLLLLSLPFPSQQCPSPVGARGWTWVAAQAVTWSTLASRACATGAR
jgi:hypothetical protein